MSWSTLPSMAAITPQYLQMLLSNAAAGQYLEQWELFDLMLDTWPVLASCVQELTYGIERKKLVFEPYAEEDEQPTPSALEKSKLCCDALCNMSPTPAEDANDFEGTVRDLISAWFVGLSACEIVWTASDIGIVPQFTQWAHPKYLAFNDSGTLGFTSRDSTGAVIWNAFPDNKFLVGIHKSKSGLPSAGALLRPLAWWWCAANFSSDWLLNLGQLFGIPWRIAKYDPNAAPETLNAIDTMLQNMGSSTWARFPNPTEIELIQPNNFGSDHSPQGEMLDRADRYARDLILGQTMTGTPGTTGKGGGQAFGKVEMSVKEDRIDAAGKFVANVINQQLIKSILVLNYGDDSEAPRLRFLNDEEGDLPEAQRDQTLVNIGVPIGVSFMRKKYGIPEPAAGEELLEKAAPKPDQFSNPADQDQSKPEEPQEPPPNEPSQTKLARVLSIEDDAIFAAELKRLAQQTKE